MCGGGDSVRVSVVVVVVATVMDEKGAQPGRGEERVERFEE